MLTLASVLINPLVKCVQEVLDTLLLMDISGDMRNKNGRIKTGRIAGTSH